MNSLYCIRNVDDLFSPALVFYKELIEKNIAEVVRLAGAADRLRPHVKTHKTREIVRLEHQHGITKHKCATIAEAEMLAQVDAADVLIAYPMVGPNIRRLARLAQQYPRTRFSCLVDHPAALEQLSSAMAAAGTTLDGLIDLDVGQHRTGVAPGPRAIDLYQRLARSPGIRPGGFHVYDGQNHQESEGERSAAVEALLAPVLQMRSAVVAAGVPVPRLVCGGTPTFPVWRLQQLPGLELSPGTFVLHDEGYGAKFADLAGFTPAAAVITRVISRPSANRVTLDLGTKAVASDPPAGKRCKLLNVGAYTPVMQNEEHFVIETAEPSPLIPGDVVYAIPTHVCPTCALHQRAHVVENGVVTGAWEIAARDRVLGI